MIGFDLDYIEVVGPTIYVGLYGNKNLTADDEKELARVAEHHAGLTGHTNMTITGHKAVLSFERNP